MKPAYQLFIATYCKNRNLSAAARAAGYSEKSAHTQGSRLIKRPDIAAAIAAFDAAESNKSQKSLEITSQRVMDELATIALFDPASMYGEDGRLLPVKDMPEATRRAIAGIEETVGKLGDKNTKLRISNKIGSLELISKIIGMVKQPDQFTPVQIIIAPAPSSSEQPRVDVAQLRPEWDEQ